MEQMSKENQEVAILLATYNGEKYLEEQLKSIANQTFKNFMCYIHDDNSSDSTKIIVRKYIKKYPDNFCLMEYDGGHGPIGNFMSLSRYVRNNTNEPYIFFSDQDDYWYPTKIEKQMKFLKKNKNEKMPFLVYCDQEIVDGDLKLISKSGMKYSKRIAGIDDSFKELVFENCAAGCTMAFNRALLEVAVDYAVETDIPMHDWWFMLVARCCGDIGYVNESLMKYRQHGANTLGADNKVLAEKVRRYMKSLRKSVGNKSRHLKLCEKQIIRVFHIKKNNFYIEQLKEINDIIYTSKPSRMIFFIKNGYIHINELFTLLFV